VLGAVISRRYFGSRRPIYTDEVSLSLDYIAAGIITIESNLQAGSDGCAPTPSQYFARTESSFISLNPLPSPSAGVFGIGSYVP